MTKKIRMKLAPFLRVSPIIKFTVATPWVRSIKAFRMQIAQKRLHGRRWLLYIVIVSWAHIEYIQTKNLNQFIVYYFTTLKFFIQYVQKPAIMSIVY